MFSNDKNIEKLAQLVEKVKEYLGMQREMLQLNAIEKVVRVLTMLVLTIILSFFLLLVVIFLSFSAAFALAVFVPTALAFLIVAAFYFLLFMLVYSNRKKWIQDPLIRMFANLLTS